MHAKQYMTIFLNKTISYLPYFCIMHVNYVRIHHYFTMEYNPAAWLSIYFIDMSVLDS